MEREVLRIRLPISPRLDAVRVGACLLAVTLFGCAPQGSDRHSPFSPDHPVMLGPILLGYDLSDLPANPTIQDQIDLGKKQIALLAEDEPTLGRNQELADYFGGIEERLTHAVGEKPPYPIVVTVSDLPETNAVALPGGQLLVYASIFDLVESESELVAILAHETAHEYHDDFLKFWHDYKIDKPVFGRDGVLDESRQFEADADLTGARMMYAAGWDPDGMVVMLGRLHALGVRARHGTPTFYSTHPRDPQRIKSVQDLIATLPPKPGLIRDSNRFHELKGKY